MVEDGCLCSPRRPPVVVGCDGMEKLGADVLLERACPLLDHAEPQMDVAEEPALERRKEERRPVELDGPTRIVEERGRDEEVPAQPGVELRRLAAKRRDRDGVLEEAAGIPVVPVARRRKRPQPAAEVLVGEKACDERTQAGVRELVGEEVEEAVELGDVPPRWWQERSGVGLRHLERANLELEPVAEVLDAPEDAHRVPLAETLVEELDVVPDARVDPAAPIRKLEREVGTPRPRAQALLARDGEDAFDDALGGKLRDRDSDRHAARV